MRLIIAADDFGIDPRRDEGICAAFTAGAITQAGFMVGSPHAQAAAQKARDIGLPLGLHLDLSEMPPLAQARNISTLVDRNGEKLGKHGFRLAMARGAVDAAHVRIEAEAQIDAFRALTGEDPIHVDGHQHVHWIEALSEPLASVFSLKGVRSVRRPAKDETRAVYRQAGLGSTCAFMGLDPSGAHEPRRMRQAIQTLESGSSVELMCHVGFAGSGGDDFNRSNERERELEILLSRPFAPLIDRGWVELVNFHELAREGALC